MLEFNDHWETELIPRENDDLNSWVYEYFNFQKVFKRRKLQWIMTQIRVKGLKHKSFVFRFNKTY